MREGSLGAEQVLALGPRPQSGPLRMGLGRESGRKQGLVRARVDLRSSLGCEAWIELDRAGMYGDGKS